MARFASGFASAILRRSAHLVILTIAGGALAGAAIGDEAALPDIAGIYEMDGDTTVTGAPDRFHVAGKLVIRQKGADCTLSVDGTFKRLEGESGPAGVALIGTGEAKLDGTRFTGSAEVQTLMSEVPGVDVGAAYMPKKFGPTLDAIAEGKVVEEGILVFEIRSTVVGEGFTLPEGRTTVVRATRVARKATELKKPRESRSSRASDGAGPQ